MFATHELPPLYHAWMADLLTGPIPRESNATCHDCAMCVKPNGEVPFSTYYFDASVKCCVYMPVLPNFLAGRILADDTSPAGQASVRARMAAKVAVTPHGIGRPPTYDLVFRNSAHTIGRSKALRCPHFVEEGGGLCGIWKHRDSTCTTWFCRHVRGQVGSEFWKAIRELLGLLEGTLARWAALEMGVRPEVLADFVMREGLGPPQQVPTALAVDGKVDDDAYAYAWGDWLGQEEAFYRACAERVSALRWSDVLSIGGPEVAILAAVARNHYGRLVTDGVPPRLKLGQFTVASTRGDGVRVTTYTPLDAIDLPTALLPHLPAFDGRPIEEVLAGLAEQGVGIDPAYLRALVDWGVLVAA